MIHVPNGASSGSPETNPLFTGNYIVSAELRSKNNPELDVNF
jgi:hypothetical protein